MNKSLFAGHKKFLLLICAISALMLISCKKKSVSEIPENEEEEDKKSKNSEFDFYSPAEDNAEWVESLLIRIEEERIAEELAKMEESRSEYLMPEFDDLLNEEDEEENAEENSEENPETAESGEAEPEEAEPVEELSAIEKFFEADEQGRILSGKNNELRFYEFQNEVLTPQIREDGYVIIHSTDGRVMRNFYNFDYQLVKKEEWNIRSASDAKKLKTEAYTYSEESGKLSQKEISTEDSVEKVSYNDAAYPLLSKKYTVKDSKQYIMMERSWAYDEENRVIKDEQKEYYYKDSNYKKSKPEVFIRKYEYQYNDDFEDDEIPADFKYYENNVLKMQNKYSSEKGNYVSWIYFDDILAVKTYYEDQVRVRDEYYNYGKLYRTKTYEKPEEE